MVFSQRGRGRGRGAGSADREGRDREGWDMSEESGKIGVGNGFCLIANA